MAPSVSTRPKVAFVYTLWFTWIDPVLSLIGAYGGFFVPNLLLASYIPDTVASPAAPKELSPNPNAMANPAHALIFNQLGGFFLLTFTLSTFLLRYTPDFTIWSLYEGAILIVDVIILVATALAYANQGRLSPFTWRPEDWFSVLVTGLCAVLRAGFVLRIGVGEKEKRN
ncbi:hypothetical protein NKR23_g6169 [Pleurostoma richardsiae]|uniref:DUF7704 domain-containing protein n=1 Tax=Pleurostoma richardsiae TaxID=41990 RepID=A0AA38RZU7_9PEZI|nr:hypothetical protein NKR23_g6169 [Pleurostoma richardsiae]